MERSTPDERLGIQSIELGFHILKVLAQHGRPMMLKDLAAQAGMEVPRADPRAAQAAQHRAADAAPARRLDELARQPGLYALSGYGARGLVWSALAAELLASALEGDPAPLERDLLEAVDPARFVLRPAGKTAVRE